MSFSATPPPTVPNPPPPPPLPPPPDIMPESSSNIGSLVRKKLALISISPTSTASTSKRRYQQEDNEMVVDTPPPKIIKIRVGGMIFGWDVVCGCKVNYRIDRIKSEYFRVSDGKKTTIDVPFSREHINFDCPCGGRCEISMNVKRHRVTKKNKKVVKKN
ncbi:hypothetical protein C5167_031847 [Papaver somniferum]|uniref:Uncharacterized protein n=1 Tax=Papaver somniferum TaxID=3469 RepID=A0A4Y7K8U2_PAPSO|nr:uncharacterized protein LOC113293427 [Papaver somniferum]RZC68631.1 hypothetical protein C5167_031847 [Papaver somniferum]